MTDTKESKMGSPETIYKCKLFLIERWGGLRPAFKQYPSGERYVPVALGFWLRAPEWAGWMLRRDRPH